MPKRASSFEESHQPQLKNHVSDLDVILNSAKLKQQLGEKTVQKLFEAAKVTKPIPYQAPEQNIENSCYNCYAEIPDGITCKSCPNYTCSSCRRTCVQCKEPSCWDCIGRAEIGYLCHLCPHLKPKSCM